MLDKMISVSPPLKGEAPVSKLADSKTFREASKSDYKKDFEKALHKKLELEKENSASKKEEAQKDEAQKQDGLRADHKNKKKEHQVSKKNDKDDESPGGIKKKVTENDDKMVSNLMASNESRVETPDFKIENLAEFEVNTSVNSSVNSSVNNKQVDDADLAQASGLLSTDAVIVKNQAEVNPQEQSKAFNLEAELGAAVGFSADLDLQQTNKDMLEKIKAFDSDKNSVLNKPQSFEQNVLSRLQNEQLLKANQVSAQSSSGESQGNLGQQGSEQLRDFKSEQQDTNQLHQAAGQSHNEFKAQLGIAPTQGHSLAKLEENREANMNEIMNQAQYLVKKGGGEVSVKMSPDGMGEVHLKVMLQDGKLNIELQTQNKDVKKLIEESLSELKSGLAAHRLSLEHVKIDTVSATNADNNTQFQSNLNQGQSEGRAHEFWNDFQGNRNNWNSWKNQSGNKNSYAETTGQSARQGSSSSRVSATSAASMAGALRTYGGTKGATVNRVA